MNSDQMEGKWKQIKGDVREKWGKLTDDDMHIVAGRREQLIGRVQERYGLAKEEATRQVDAFVKSVDDTPNREFTTSNIADDEIGNRAKSHSAGR